MATTTALTTLADEDSALDLSEALEAMTPEPVGVGVFEIEDGSGRWEVGAYYTEAPDPIVLALLAKMHGAEPFAISELPDIDWVAHVRRELHPVEAGRFFLYGSHDAGKVPPGRIGLQIEAAVAFGTGHHGTTTGCLKALDRLVTAGHVARNIADIGTGTGVLALAAAAVWPAEVCGRIIASDIDEVAVKVAVANAEINGMADRVICLEAAGFDHPDIAAAAPFDLVFANILKGPLIELAPSMAAHVGQGGLLILSGLLTTQAEAVGAAYTAAGFTAKDREDIGDWATLVLKRA